MAEPNKLQESFIHLLHKKPLLGVLLLETDNGKIDLAINEAGARELLGQLQKFLGDTALRSTKK